MILPILAYGHDVLRQPCREVMPGEDGLERLIDNMWHTMQNARGCGLAAPQVNEPMQLFIVDSKSTYDAFDPEERTYFFHEADTGIQETFINAEIVDSSVETWEDEEGCLSIPNLARPVTRPISITIAYSDQDFTRKTRSFSGTTARMIQHEYDHTRGILYLDYLNPLAKKLIAGKLKKISAGLLPAKYPMTYIVPAV